MQFKVPIKRVLSGFLATAMTLSMIPSQITNASNVFNNQTQPSGILPGSYSGVGDAQGPGSGRYALKLSLYWAPAAEGWTVDTPEYDWTNSTTVLDGVFIRQKEITEAEQAIGYIPARWYQGGAIGSHIGTQSWETHWGSSWFHTFTSYSPWVFDSAYSIQTQYYDKSAAVWYELTGNMGIESSWAQEFAAENNGRYPTVALDLEEWRSSIFDMEREYKDSNNQLTFTPDITVDLTTSSGAVNDYSSILGTYLKADTNFPQLPLMETLFGPGWSGAPKTAAIEDGYRLSTDNYTTSYFGHPYYINWLSSLIAEEGTSYVDTSKTSYWTSTWFGTTSVLTGTIHLYDGEVITGGSYKLCIEPVQYRNAGYPDMPNQIAEDKDTFFFVMGYKDWVEYTRSRYAEIGTIAGNSGFRFSQNYWSNMAVAYQLGEPDEYLNVWNIREMDVDGDDGGVAAVINRTLENNPWGMFVVTFPTVPEGEPVDPLPTIIKTYVEIESFNADGTPNYVKAAPSTLAATMSAAGKQDWEDTGYISLDGTVTQSPNIHLWEGIDILDDDGVPIEDPATGQILTQRAYLNDVITLSDNVKSTAEDTEWVDELPTGLTLNGSEYGIEPSANYITSYHFDLLMNAEQFQEVTTLEEFHAGLTTIDAKYPQVGDTFPKSWFEKTIVRYADDATSVTDVNPIEGANFIDEGGLMDHVKGYYKADQVYQAKATVGAIDGMSGEYRYIPNTTLNYLMGFNEDGTEQVREDIRNEALTSTTQSGSFGSSKYLTEEDPNPVDQQNANPNMMGSYEYGSNVTVLRYIVGEPPEIPNTY